MKTLTYTGLEKQARRFAEDISRADFFLNGVPGSCDIFRRSVEGDTVTLYVYFGDEVSGTIENIRLIDSDGDAVCESDRVFVKPETKGLYVAFKYRFTEMEVDSVEAL